MPIKFEREVTRGPFSLFAAFDSRQFNRLRLQKEWLSESDLGLTMSWDNAVSDPVWLLSLTVTMPNWLILRLYGPPAPSSDLKND